MNEIELLPSDLTPRELETLDLIARGFSNGEIMKKLNITYATVKTHVSSIYLKFNYTNIGKTSESSVLRTRVALRYLEAKGYLNFNIKNNSKQGE